MIRREKGNQSCGGWGSIQISLGDSSRIDACGVADPLFPAEDEICGGDTYLDGRNDKQVSKERRSAAGQLLGQAIEEMR